MNFEENKHTSFFPTHSLALSKFRFDNNEQEKIESNA